MNMMTHLILIRHGQIQANLDRLWHGWTNSPLTPIGSEQATLVADRISREHHDATALYASPLIRTTDTARAIGSAIGLSVISEPRIKEYGIGVLEGTSFDALRDQHDFFGQVERDPRYRPTDGESISEVADRVEAALTDIANRHPGEKVIAVSHGAAMALGLARLLDGDHYAWNKYQFNNTGVTELTLASKPELVRFNCVEHLGSLL